MKTEKPAGALHRRDFIALASAMGATLAWAGSAKASALSWSERRDLYPEGVASGDPEPDSVILWTRRPFEEAGDHQLTAEIALDADFWQVVGRVRAPVSADADWTCRVLAAGLRPATVYWYRFVDDAGAGSRVGRTITAPNREDTATRRFAFVSCQSVNEGAMNAWRRMIWEDEQASPERQLGFVLHLGDFIYEVVEYPEEVSHRYDRTVFDLGKIPDGRKVGNFHVPTTLDGYRMVYRAHIHDPDIQDARARWPFMCIGDNHEFSWQGFQSFIKYGGPLEPAQELRVAANQAWWEFIPSRVTKASGPGLERFDPPEVHNTPITRFDADGLGDEPNNHAALASMTAYRSLRYGRHIEVIVTDHHSFNVQDPTSLPEAADLSIGDFLGLMPLEAVDILDGGSAYNGGNPPDTIAVGDLTAPNFRKNEPPVTLLGRVQKAWFKRTLAGSDATWKIWGASNGTLDWRVDPQNLPAGLTGRPWPGEGYALGSAGDLGGIHGERAELYDFIRDQGVEGFVTVSGDRHSFWAGYSAKALPPEAFEPVGIVFIGGSISSPGFAESTEHNAGLQADPLGALFVAKMPDGGFATTVNLTLKHGVKSALEYVRSGDLAAAHRVSNPDNAPHLEFIDMGGHGYSVVTAGPEAVETEFVCIPRPIQRATTPDGGPIRYRVTHTAQRWRSGERPHLVQRIVEGDVGLAT